MNDNKTLVVVQRRCPANREDQVKILSAWTASGLSGREFGQQVGVAPHLLYGWRRATRRSEQPGRRFVEVPGGMTVTNWAAEVATRNGVVRLSSMASPSWAGKLIRELSQC